MNLAVKLEGMDKKPIKRKKDIVKLSRDHHASLLFCWKLRQGVKHHIAAGRMLKYVNYFWSEHFAPHFGEEEAYLFAKLKDDMVLKAMNEHRNIREFIESLHAAETHHAHKQLLQLADMVNDHVRYEERVLFPHLESVFSDDQLRQIGEEISDETLLDNYQDAFWESPSSL